jgi:hypothetical protein
MGAAEKKANGGFALFGLVVGLATGLSLYAIGEFWLDKVEDKAIAGTVLCAVVFFSAALLLLSERGVILRAFPVAAVIATILALPTYPMLEAMQSGADLTPFPCYFWFFISGPLSAYLMTTLAKASLQTRMPPPYDAVFFHGLTLPLIAGGAKFFAGLAVILLFAWAMLLKSMEVAFFHDLFKEPWFILPFIGAIGGLSIAMMRGLETVLGALRFILLLFCRIAMPITAVFSLTFLAVLAVKGPAAIFIGPTPGGIMLALAFAGMLIFNGVYQNGEGGPPPLWLRLATVVALATFPIYAGLAAYAFGVRIHEYGLTPPRVIGLAMNGLAALYSVVCFAGLVTELNWRGQRWMPLVAPLNTVMAAIWIVVLVALATPFADPWALSAKNQAERLIAGKVQAADFDYGYLRFSLGEPGARALDRLVTLEDYPEIAEIRAGVARARAAPNRWSYDHPEALPEEIAPAPEGESPSQPGPMELPLNPGKAASDEAGEPDPDR